MTADYWTITGFDIWRMDERPVFDLKNLNTGQVVTCSNITEVKEQKFVPVPMPKIKTTKRKITNQKVKTTKSRGKPKYKGVSKSKDKFRAQFWDKVLNKVVHLGTFDSELLAAAAYQEHIGNIKEAKRLRNEYEEGDCRPEVPDVVHKKIFQEDKSLGQFQSEE